MSSMRRTWRRERQRIYGTPHHPVQTKPPNERESLDGDLKEEKKEEKDE
jgi:hypothetical protein